MAASSPVAYFQAALKEYFNSSNFSDVIIRCEGKEYKAHRLVLCAQSKWFSNACNGDWKEAAEGTIELPDDDLPIVEAMLNFLYHFDYQASTSPMIFNAKVYGIADKYNIPTLKSKAIEKSRKSVETCWSMDDFPHAIREIYSSTPGNDRGLRDLVVKIACEHMETLSEQPEFRILLEEAYGFAADVVLFMAKGSFERIKTHKCPNCGKTWEGVAPSGPNYYCLRCGSYRSDWEAHVVHR